MLYRRVLVIGRAVEPGRLGVEYLPTGVEAPAVRVDVRHVGEFDPGGTVRDLRADRGVRGAVALAVGTLRRVTGWPMVYGGVVMMMAFQLRCVVCVFSETCSPP